MRTHSFNLLLHGIDTLQCAYFLEPQSGCSINFDQLGELKESLRQAKCKKPAVVDLAGESFLLHPYGTASGFPFVLENEDFKIECGEFNKPNFYVTFKSQALWRQSAWLLHEKFLKWSRAAGFAQHRPEALSRVDFCFDYHLPFVDFNADSFVSRSMKDSLHREGKQVQTFTFGKGNVVLRVYDKIAEIHQQSHKVWFFTMWGQDSDVWRIEWQVRRATLKEHDIKTFDDLKDQQGDLLRYLANDHDTLRIPTTDTNSSRWPLHPLWIDLQSQIADLNNLGVHRVVSQPAALEERLERIAISMMGYMKRIAAVRSVQINRNNLDLDDALKFLRTRLNRHYEPIAWQDDVDKRIKEIRHGKW